MAAVVSRDGRRLRNLHLHRKDILALDDDEHIADELCEDLHQEEKATYRQRRAQRVVDRLPMRHRGLADLPGVDRDLQRDPEQTAEKEEGEDVDQDVERQRKS